MPAVGQTNLTLVDHAKRRDPDGKIATIAELLNKQNEVLQDMPWKEGNLPTGHQSTIRTGLPTVYFRAINSGVPTSKSRTVQVVDTCAMIEGYSEIDVKLIALNGQDKNFRLSEDSAFLESMAQKQVDTLFYGNTNADPTGYMGIAPRFNSTAAENGENIIKAGGSGSDNTSIYLVGWGEQSVFGIYPKGSEAGLKFEDLGEDTVIDANGGRYQAVRSHFTWDCGLAMKNWQYVVRIANIDVSDLTKNAASGADLVDLMTQAVELLPNTNNVKPVFYCNRTIRSFLRRQIQNRSNIYLTHETVDGKKVTMYDGLPIRRVDSILNTESVVV